MTGSNTPRHQYFSSQDIIAPNINTYYERVIRDIDNYRSRFNAITSNISQSISIKDIDSLFIKNEVNGLVYQESRCNAFYRLIGLPVVNGDGTDLYSPGFDPAVNRDKERMSERLKIANSALKKLKNILDAREIYPKNINRFFQPQDANSSALAICSTFTRTFADQLKPGVEPLDIDNQSFIVPNRDLTKFLFPEELNQVVENQLTLSNHILKPFIVDPRIELTVTPAGHRICVPFLVDKSQTQLSKGNYLKRPYIEKVIRVRFNEQNVMATSNKYIDNIIDFAKSNIDITDTSIVESLSNTLKLLHKSELVNISKLIRALEAFVLELVDSCIKIDKIRTFINWKPIPNVNGPEFGSTLNTVNPRDTQNQKLEKQIIDIEIQKLFGTTEFNIGKSGPDLGNFIFSDIDDIIFDSTKHNSDFYDKQLKILNRNRNEYGNQANELLKNIEIITGEFSGLGLIDVLVIQIALWSVSKAALLGLIDTYAFLRMQEINELKTDESPLPPLEALKEFEKKVSETYTLVNYFYNNIIDSDKKNIR